MANYYDPFDPWRGMARGGSSGGRRVPTMQDFEQLAAAFRESQTNLEELGKRYRTLLEQSQTRSGQEDEYAKQVRMLEQELNIKNEALHKQGESLKETESELLFERAARQKLEEERVTLAEEAPQWQEKFVRLQADMENMRKRWEQRKEQDVRNERNRILEDMLPLADHLDLALNHAGETEDGAQQEFVKNIEATRHAFLETLKRYGVERMKALGAPFDPAFHEAVGQEPSADVPADHVSHVLQAGYRDGDRVLRPARVMISAG
ncbi:MAG: nucleotide exchange factor GrpE [Caldilineaceae bacterium]|nr:nucleotide exchange factor GrpE [Caldilineaceae bacterium]